MITPKDTTVVITTGTYEDESFWVRAVVETLEAVDFDVEWKSYLQPQIPFPEYVGYTKRRKLCIGYLRDLEKRGLIKIHRRSHEVNLPAEGWFIDSDSVETSVIEDFFKKGG